MKYCPANSSSFSNYPKNLSANWDMTFVFYGFSCFSKVLDFFNLELGFLNNDCNRYTHEPVIFLNELIKTLINRQDKKKEEEN